MGGLSPPCIFTGDEVILRREIMREEEEDDERQNISRDGQKKKKRRNGKLDHPIELPPVHTYRVPPPSPP